MGYAIAQGACWVCGRIFAFNPLRVPSMRQEDGRREPICRSCMEKVNATRARKGLPPHPILPDAYSPIDENELPEGDGHG